MDTANNRLAENTRLLMDLREPHERAMCAVVVSEFNDFERNVLSLLTPDSSFTSSAQQTVRDWVLAGTRKWGTIPETLPLRRLARLDALRQCISSGSATMPSKPSALVSLGIFLRAVGRSARPRSHPVRSSVLFMAVALTSAAVHSLSLAVAASQSAAIDTLRSIDMKALYPVLLANGPQIIAFAVFAALFANLVVSGRAAKRLARVIRLESDLLLAIPHDVFETARDEAQRAMTSFGAGFFGATVDEAVLAIALASSNQSSTQGSIPQDFLRDKLGIRINASLRQEALLGAAENIALGGIVPCVDKTAGPSPSKTI